MSVLIVIPARLQATRLPNKPLAMIGDAPMIVHVWRRAMESGVGEVVVACDGPEIKDAIEKAGGRAVITDPDHPSGSDRVWEAVEKLSGAGTRGGEAAPATAPPRSLRSGSLRPSQLRTPISGHDIIINLQGDVPTLEPRLLKDLLKPLENPAVDIATLVAEIKNPEEHSNPSVVKAVLAFHSMGSAENSLPIRGRAGEGEGALGGEAVLYSAPHLTSTLMGEELRIAGAAAAPAAEAVSTTSMLKPRFSSWWPPACCGPPS